MLKQNKSQVLQVRVKIQNSSSERARSPFQSPPQSTECWPPDKESWWRPWRKLTVTGLFLEIILFSSEFSSGIFRRFHLHRVNKFSPWVFQNHLAYYKCEALWPYEAFRTNDKSALKTFFLYQTQTKAFFSSNSLVYDFPTYHKGWAKMAKL